MDIQSTTSSAAAAAASARAAAEADDKGVISSDFETFLTLLTAQMENQDPLNPIDSTDYATQLATFSSVEQQVLTNDLLEGLKAQMTLTGMSDLAGWVGMDARMVAPAYFDGATPITVSPNPPVNAEKVELVAYSEFGTEAWRQEIPVSTEAFNWQPRDVSGNPLPVGNYDLKLESSANGKPLETVPAEIYARVNEVRTVAGETALVVHGGSLVQSSAVTAIREASS